MNIYLAWTGTILYWISWPIGIGIFYLFVAAVVALPFRALVKLEVRVNETFSVRCMSLIICFVASVQLYRRCGTDRPTWRTGSILHLQHLPSTSPSRLDARASQRTDFQAVPPGESTTKGKITAYHAITRQHHHQPHQRLQQRSWPGWPSQPARPDNYGRNGLRLLIEIMLSPSAAASA